VMQMIYMIVGASNIVCALFGVICPGHPYGMDMSKVDNGGQL